MGISNNLIIIIIIIISSIYGAIHQKDTMGHGALALTRHKKCKHTKAKITRESVHGNKWVFHIDLNWDVVGSTFYVHREWNHFSPVMVLLIMGIASRLWSDDERVVRAGTCMEVVRDIIRTHMLQRLKDIQKDFVLFSEGKASARS